MGRNDPYRAIVERGRRNRKAYVAAITALKRRDRAPVERLFAEAGEAAFETIDCLSCGRCCRELGPRLTQADIGRLARRERMKPSVFVEMRLRIDEDGDAVFSALPCPFLGSDGYCSVYEERPKACRDYPHFAGSRKDALALHMENLSFCPAVVLAAESIIEEQRP